MCVFFVRNTSHANYTMSALLQLLGGLAVLGGSVYLVSEYTDLDDALVHQFADDEGGNDDTAGAQDNPAEQEQQPQQEQEQEQKPASELEKRVFSIGPYTVNAAGAQAQCQKYGARLATAAEVHDAFNNGASWCSWGWVQDDDGTVRQIAFPHHTESATGISGRNPDVAGCSDTRVHIGPHDPTVNFGVNCYGVPPDAADAKDGDWILGWDISPSPDHNFVLARNHYAPTQFTLMEQVPDHDWSPCLNRCAQNTDCVLAVHRPSDKRCFLHGRIAATGQMPSRVVPWGADVTEADRTDAFFRVKYARELEPMNTSDRASFVAEEHQLNQLIQCPVGRTLRVQSALYGPVDDRADSDTCARISITAALKNLVDGKSSHMFDPNMNAIAGDPCPGVVKKITGQYTCM